MTSVLDYQSAYEMEAAKVYPMVDALEFREGFAIDRAKLDAAARILACPVKAHPPNWQHGRVLYAVTRRYLADVSGPVLLLDIGTAKGFSALCLQWALMDSLLVQGGVISVDVIDPAARVRRNTVAEVEGLKTLPETLVDFPEAQRITFYGMSGVQWLREHPERAHVAFIDGKHSEAAVQQEGIMLAGRQQPGDVVIFDDVQIAGVERAVRSLKASYVLEYVAVLPNRMYAIGRRR